MKIMKTAIQSVAVFALLAAGATVAQAQVQSAETGFATPISQYQSTLTRQEVTNAVLEARANGTLITNRADELRVSMNQARGTSTLTRAEVKAQTIANLKSSDRMPGESSM